MESNGDIRDDAAFGSWARQGNNKPQIERLAESLAERARGHTSLALKVGDTDWEKGYASALLSVREQLISILTDTETDTVV